MKYRELVGSLFWMGVGAPFCIGALGYGLFREGVPEPGLLPFFAGSIMIVLGVSVLITSVKEERGGKTSREKIFPERESSKRLFTVVFALSAYIASVEYLGFPLTTFLFMIFLLRFIEPQRWFVIVAASILTTASSYLLFQIFLKTQLPKGILGI